MASNLVLYITNKQIWVKGEGNEEIKEYSWDEGTIKGLLGQFKLEYGRDKFKIILGSDISYCFTLKGRAENIDRQAVLSAAKLEAPEGIDDNSFDWQVVNKIDENEELDLVQVCGMRKRELQAISLATLENKIEIMVMLPVGIFLAKESEKIQRNGLLLWAGRENLAMIVRKGVVFYVQSLGQDFDDEIKKLVALAKDKLGMEVKDLILNINKWQGVSEIFPDWEVNHFELEPWRIINAYGKQKGEDSEVLDIKTQEKMDGLLEVVPVEQEFKKEKEKKKLLSWGKILIGILLALLVGGGIFLLSNRNNKTEEKVEVEEIIEATLTPTPINLSKFKIQVLNGNGEPGVATAVEGKLLEKGFFEIETGNADSYDYDLTEIEHQASLSAEVIGKIEEVLASEYESTSSASLPDENEYDVVITVGKGKN